MNPKKHTIFTISALIMFAATVTYAESIPIEPAETTCGDINQPAEVDVFTFFGQRPCAVTILVSEIPGTGEPGFDPHVELRAPDGSKVKYDWDGTSVTIRQHLTQCGTWHIIVRDHDGTHTGEYCLSLIMNPGPTTHESDPNGGPIAPAQTKTGSIDVGDLDAFTFSANAGDTVTIVMSEIPGTGEAGFDPQVELHAPDGNVVTTPGWGISSETIQAQHLTQTGTYFIITRDHDGYHTGQYGLSLIKNPGPTTHESDPNGGPIRTWDPDPKTGTIDVGDLDAFTFWGNPNDIVMIVMSEIPGTGEVGFDPQVELHAPDGNWVTTGWGVSSVTIEATLTQFGTYFIITRDHDGYHWGEYYLNLTRLYDIGTTPAIASLSVDPNSVVQGDPIMLTASGVTDWNGWVVQVDFYRDFNRDGYLELDGTDQFLGSDTNGGDGWDWTGVISGFPLVGENRYFARAMDNSDAWSDPARCTGTITPLTITGDLDHDGKVDLLDFSIFAAAWQTEPGDPEWNPVCDISDPPDDVIDFKDLRELVKHWLEGY